MAGVGVKLKRIYEKKSITASVFGIGYSVIITVAPILFIVVSVWAMEKVLGFANESYLTRDLFSSMLLYYSRYIQSIWPVLRHKQNS